MRSGTSERPLERTRLVRTVARWLLVIPAAVAAWYAVFIVALFTHQYIEQNVCPEADLASGACQNAAIQRALVLVIYVSVSVSALAVELAAAAMAPSHKAAVVWVMFIAGSLVAASLLESTGMRGEGASAMATGLVGAVALSVYLGQRAQRGSA
jgi:hypothetical protein